MKKITFLILFLITFNLSYSQEYVGLNGYLKVKNGIWNLTWQNNNYKILTDWAYLELITKSEVEELFNDMMIALESKEAITIQKSKYKVFADKSIILLYNDKEQYMTIPKKYSKKGFESIKESINYLK
jgi:hypothetical protein